MPTLDSLWQVHTDLTEVIAMEAGGLEKVHFYLHPPCLLKSRPVRYGTLEPSIVTRVVFRAYFSEEGEEDKVLEDKIFAKEVINFILTPIYCLPLDTLCSLVA